MQLCYVDSRVTTYYLALCLTYLAASLVVHLNPAKFPQYAVLLSGQATNIIVMVMFLSMAQRSHRHCETFKTQHFAWGLCALMAASLLVRLCLLGMAPENFSVWDSFMSVFTLIAVLCEIFFVMFSASALHLIVFALLLVFGAPLLTTVPRWMREGVRPNKETLDLALVSSKRAYSTQTTIVDEDTSTALVIDKRTGRTFVGFRGTEEVKDWLTNVNMKPARVPWLAEDVKVHSGFLKAYTSVRQRLMDAVGVDATGSEGSEIVFCGHSLGGALATLAAMDFAHNAPFVRVKVYTFGAPQVGDIAFVTEFNKVVGESVRVVNPHDKVPDVLAAGYLHTKGYYPVTSLTKDVFPLSHSLSTYIAAISRPRALSILGIFTPTLYVIVSLLALFLWHKFVRQHL